MSEVTRILGAIEAGDTQAAERLLPLAYDELRRIAAQKMAGERAGHTLQPTALVHEAYLRLVNPDGSQPHWNSRGHFFSAAANAMRQILIENARRKLRLKRGAGAERVTFDEELFESEAPADEILAVHEALTKLEGEHPAYARVAVMRYFAGMTIEETASALDISESTVERHWRGARAWLEREIAESR